MTQIFQRLDRARTLIGRVRDYCNKDRVLNKDGETVQDTAYYNASDAYALLDMILAEALDAQLDRKETP